MGRTGRMGRMGMRRRIDTAQKSPDGMRFPHKSRSPITRRDALCRIGNGFGMLAFASLVGESIARAAGPLDQDGGVDRRKLDHPARAKRVIFLFMNGGLSQ